MPLLLIVHEKHKNVSKAIEKYMATTNQYGSILERYKAILDMSSAQIIEEFMKSDTFVEFRVRRFERRFKNIKLLIDYGITGNTIGNNLWLIRIKENLLKEKLEIMNMYQLQLPIEALKLKSTKVKLLCDYFSNSTPKSIHPGVLEYTTLMKSVKSVSGIHLFKPMLNISPVTSICRRRTTLHNSVTDKQMYYSPSSHKQIQTIITREGECYTIYFYHNLNILLLFGFKITDIYSLPVILCHDTETLAHHLSLLHTYIDHEYFDDCKKTLNILQYYIEKNRNFTNRNAVMVSIDQSKYNKHYLQ